MRIRYFGDSYDIVKKSLLTWLAPGEAWSVHPMFTEAVSPDEASAFSQFLGAPLVTTQVLVPATDRVAYFASAAVSKNLFLDPDTGVRAEAGRGSRDPRYIYVDELVSLVRGRPSSLTLVFDQSVPRGSESAAILRKLEAIARFGIRGFAYVSHACFLVLSVEPTSLEKARKHLFEHSRLPVGRIAEMPAV